MSTSRVPRASIPVTFLKDPDVLALMHSGPEGHIALWAWTGLLLLAKDQKNGGVFRGPMAIYAPSIGMDAKILNGAVNRINEFCRVNGNKPWIVVSEFEFRIRNWEKWNMEWGGGRRGAGRPKNQVAHLENNMNTELGHLEADSASASASASEIKKEDAQIPPRLDTPEFRKAWEEYRADRKERKKTMTHRAEKMSLAKVEPLGPRLAIEAINNAIAGGWTSLWDPSGKRNGTTPPKKTSPIGTVETW